MSLRRGPARLLLVGWLAWGCAYYNGLYNANRLAADAERARREGRPGEARSLWERAALKAESVAVRYPRSRYRDDALLLQGEALRAAAQCARAIPPLLRVADSGRDETDRLRASLWAGQCQVESGDHPQALRRLAPLRESGDPSVAREARLWHARAALRTGDPETALQDLETDRAPAAAFDRAAALLALGRAPEAIGVLHARVAGDYDEVRWLSLIDTLAGFSPLESARLVDSLVRRPGLTSGQRARLLLADARRVTQAGDPGAAAVRLEQVLAVAPDSAEARAARSRLLLLRLETIEIEESIVQLIGSLKRIANDGGAGAAEAALMARVLERANGAAGQPHPDLMLFIAAEQVRDSLYAPALAASLFRLVQQRHPRSAIAPKALLAAAALQPDSTATLLARVDSLYPESPYRVLALRGDGAAFAVLEDSLQRLLRDSAPDAGPAAPGPPVEGDDREIRRPRPPASRRVPEP